MPDKSAFAALVQERRSTRGFLPDRVSDELLADIFSTAQWAPSNCNTQPWVVHVVSGDAAERLRAALYEGAARGKPMTADFPPGVAYQGEYRIRQIEAAKALFGAQNITRDDMEGRTRSFLRNFRFFDAPHAAFVFLHEDFGMREAADCGIFAQTLMLALTANGLASCAQGALSHHADIVRAQLDIAPSHKLLFGIAFGYEDPAHPANAARVTRATVEEAITFHG